MTVPAAVSTSSVFFTLLLQFPAWLASNKAALSLEQYEHHGKQFKCFQRLVATYETEPDNFPRLMALMQDVRRTGGND